MLVRVFDSPGRDVPQRLRVRAYKTISRLDFPLSFALVDNLGKFAEVLHEESSKPPMVRKSTNLNLPKHIVNCTASVGEDEFEFNLGLGSLDFLVEYKGGKDFAQTSKHPVVALADLLVRRLEEAKVQRIERIGFRNWILVEHEKFTFEALREVLIKRLPLLRAAVAATFPQVEDVAAIVEAATEDSQNVRVITGPYRAAESEKYFSSDPAVTEALIVDIDVWQRKLEMPRLSLMSLISAQQKMSQRVVEQLVQSLREELR